MNTDDLIDSLTKDVKPMPRHALRRRLIAGLILGGGGTLLAVGVWLGFRPDLWIAMHGGAFWMKWLYTASLALCATLATARLGRPDGGALGCRKSVKFEDGLVAGGAIAPLGSRDEFLARGSRDVRPAGQADAAKVLRLKAHVSAAHARRIDRDEQARDAGLGVNAGHDLDQKNLGALKRAIPFLDEVSIGHALIGEALYDGLAATVRNYLSILAQP